LGQVVPDHAGGVAALLEALGRGRDEVEEFDGDGSSIMGWEYGAAAG
jgi:hypothetical protein